MAITYGFFNSQNGDRKYNADQMSEYFKGLVSNGVYESVGGALQVLATSGMTVNVQTGRAIIDCKWVENDAILPLTITAAHVTLNRYTAVVVRLDYVNRLMTITTKDGTPASSPNYPSLTNNSSMVEICLAYIYVPAGLTSITQSRITDTRANTNICGWVTGLIKQVDTSQLFLQWQTAYQEAIADMEAWEVSMKTQFDSWMETLTDQLQVNTYIEEYSKYINLTSSMSGIIPLDMTGYTYESSDIFFISINGLTASENVDYYLDTSQTPVELHVNLTGTASSEQVDIKVLKSKIGFAS